MPGMNRCGWFPRLRCQRKVTWSTYRGGCRFDAAHDGDCKPAAGKR